MLDKCNKNSEIIPLGVVFYIAQAIENSLSLSRSIKSLLLLDGLLNFYLTHAKNELAR